jgi:hypothetical protein
MSDDENIKSSIARTIELNERFSYVKEIKAFDNAEEPESWRVALGLVEIKESIDKILVDIVPKITKDNPDNIYNIRDIELQLNHILWHIENMKFIIR